MGRLKRVLLSVMEICVVLVGSVISVVLTELLDSNAIFICGTALTICITLAIHRKTRNWKINYAAEDWIQQRNRPPLSLNRVTRSKALRQVFLWLPSTCAALVLCFSPLASHFLYSGELIDHRVPIPWTWAIVYRYQNPGLASSVDALISSKGVGRFGVTPFWQKRVKYSVASFAAYTWNLTPEDERDMDYLRRLHATDISQSEFTVGELRFACVEYLTSYSRFPNFSGFSIQCESPTPGAKGHFVAALFGQKEDAPAFYDVLRHVRPID